MSSVATVGVVVVAAGSGTRLGAEVPKAFVSLGARSILVQALESVFGMTEPVQVVVVAPAAQLVLAQDELRDAAGAAIEYASVIVGGSTRQESVAAGLAALWPDVGVVLVHDAARPFTPTALFEAVVAHVRATGDGVIPGIPVADTLKRTDAGVAAETVDRSILRAVQTPQGFPRLELAAAYASAREDHTDDAALFAGAGHTVRVIEGDPLAFKITTPWDLRRAQSLVATRPSTDSGTGFISAASTGGSSVSELVEGRHGGAFRTGIGIDVHAFDDTSPLWLGDLYWPDEPGLSGHSDGDALAHAICDALLSAAGLGDLGSRFGTSDPRFAGAHGEVFIRETVLIVEGAGYTIQNVAVQLIGSRPKLAPRRSEVEKHLSDLVGAPVSVAATTSDGLGFTGRSEGIAAMATALVIAS